MSYEDINLAEVVSMREAGRSWQYMARHYDVRHQHIRNWVKAQPDVPEWVLEPLPNGRPAATKEDLEIMVEEGLNDKQIAARLKMNLSALQRLRFRRGVIRREDDVNRGRVSEEKLAEVESLLDEGMSYAAASQISGVGRATISRRFPGRGFTPEQTLEASLMGRQLSKIAA